MPQGLRYPTQSYAFELEVAEGCEKVVDALIQSTLAGAIALLLLLLHLARDAQDFGGEDPQVDVTILRIHPSTQPSTCELGHLPASCCKLCWRELSDPWRSSAIAHVKPKAKARETARSHPSATTLTPLMAIVRVSSRLRRMSSIAAYRHLLLLLLLLLLLVVVDDDDDDDGAAAVLETTIHKDL